MTKDAEYYRDIYQKFLNGHCSKEELLDLSAFIEKEEGFQAIKGDVLSALESTYGYSTVEMERAKIIVENVDPMIKQLTLLPTAPKYKSMYAKWISVAAILSIGIGIWAVLSIYNNKVPSSKNLLSNQGENINPGRNRATIILSDGSAYELSDKHTAIEMKGNAIKYANGEVLIDELSGSELTVQTPRGGQYQLILPDGTKVWLNAASTLKYPNKFSSEERLVSLEGEAYFEVEKDRSRPFLVKTSKETIKVLGTHFNVNSYKMDVKSSVALIEGKVHVSNMHGDSKILSPNQQTINQTELHVQAVDPTEVLAWKNGEFMFYDVELGAVMKQIERWYDIDVDIDPTLENMLIWGAISRYENLDKVLNIIKLTDDRIKVQIKGRRVKFML